MDFKQAFFVVSGNIFYNWARSSMALSYDANVTIKEILLLDDTTPKKIHWNKLNPKDNVFFEIYINN